MPTLSIALSLLSACAVTALAGTRSTLEVLGFSKDGTRLAYELSSVHDATGVPASAIRIVDVPANRFIGELYGAAHRIPGTDEGDPKKLGEVRARARKKAAKTLASVGIVLGETGTRALSRRRKGGPEDFSASFEAGKDSYRLTLSTRQVDVPACLYPFEGKAALFELTLTELRTGLTTTLQRDTRYTKSRNCAYGYGIAEVYVYGRSLAVFVETEEPGFEGADASFLAVTGRLSER